MILMVGISPSMVVRRLIQQNLLVLKKWKSIAGWWFGTWIWLFHLYCFCHHPNSRTHMTDVQYSKVTGWWFGTCFFHNIWDVIRNPFTNSYSYFLRWLLHHQPVMVAYWDHKSFTIWLVVWNMFFFSYVGNNNPNWLLFSRTGRYTTNA